MKWGIGNIKGGSGGASNTMLTTTTDATENSGTYTLALSNLSETPKVNDYVVYVDNGNLTTLYQVSAIGSTNATLEKIGNIGGGGGKQLYQHNIALKDTTPLRCYITIINDNNTPFTSKMLYDFLIDNNMTNDTKSYEATGVYSQNVIHSICAYSNQIYFNWGTAGNDKSYASLTNAITDTIIAL